MSLHQQSTKASTPSYFITAIICGLPLIAIVLVGLQATENAIIQLPPSISGVADFFPGPSAKIEELNELGRPNQANKYRSFITIFLLMLFAAIVVSIPYVWARNIGISTIAKKKRMNRSEYILAVCILGFAFYQLFFSGNIEFEPRVIALTYDIHLGVGGYVLDICFGMFVYVLCVAPFLYYNHWFRNGSDGSIRNS